MKEKLVYFIPNWEADSKLDEEKISFLSFYFCKQNIMNKVLVTNFIPFLRYKLNEYGYNYEQVVRVFDILQNIKKSFGHPLSIDDVDIPKDLTRIYTPNSIILLRGHETVGKVLYNKYGFISNIVYYTAPKDFRDHIYDDRGFLSQTKYYDDGELKKIEYFNESGNKTLTEFQDRIIIEESGSNFFTKEKYDTLDEMINEILLNILEESHKDYLETDISVITTTEKNIIAQTKNLEIYNVIRIVSDEGIEDDIENENVKIVVDSYQNKVKHKDSILIPIFFPELMLGRSNYSQFHNIYCALSEITSSYKRKTVTNIIRKVVNDSTLSLSLELKSPDLIAQIKSIQTTVIEESYGIKISSKEYKQVEEYIISKKEKRMYSHMSENIKELQRTSDWHNLVDAVEANIRIDYLLFNDMRLFEKKLQDSRIYIDLEESYSVLKHSKAVSVGIPIITIHESDYIILNQNGKILDRELLGELETYLDYYVYNLNNWNTSLICCVELIKSFESDYIKNKWQEIL